MITKIPISEFNRTGEFFAVMLEDEWLLCDSLTEVATILFDNKVKKQDIGAIVSKMNIRCLPRFEQGKIEAIMESLEHIANKG